MKKSDETPLVAASGECTVCPIAAALSPAKLYLAYGRFSRWLASLADVVPPLFLRIILAYEFGEAGLEKLHGENWFGDLLFPFPFNLLPPDGNWQLATGFEILGAAALILGLATRFFSFALVVITLVAIASVHWPAEWSTLSELLEGYAITDEGHGNYKLPLIYLAMLSPLLFGGAGRLSLDHWLSGRRIKLDTATLTGCGAGSALKDFD